MFVVISSSYVVQQVVLTNQMTTRIIKGQKSQLVPALGECSDTLETIYSQLWNTFPKKFVVLRRIY